MMHIDNMLLALRDNREGLFRLLAGLELQGRQSAVRARKLRAAMVERGMIVWARGGSLSESL